MVDYKLVERLKTLCPNVYPGAAPLDYQRPCIVYNRIKTDPTRDLDDSDDTATVTFQIDTYSTLQTEAISLARSVRDSMKAWQDDDVQCAAYTARQDMIDNTTETQLYRVMHYFEVFTRD